MQLDWFQYRQITDLFDVNKMNYGFKDKNSKLEEILINQDKKYFKNI